MISRSVTSCRTRTAHIVHRDSLFILMFTELQRTLSLLNTSVSIHARTDNVHLNASKRAPALKVRHIYFTGRVAVWDLQWVKIVTNVTSLGLKRCPAYVLEEGGGEGLNRMVLPPTFLLAVILDSEKDITLTTCTRCQSLEPMYMLLIRCLLALESRTAQSRQEEDLQVWLVELGIMCR